MTLDARLDRLREAVEELRDHSDEDGWNYLYGAPEALRLIEELREEVAPGDPQFDPGGCTYDTCRSFRACQAPGERMCRRGF